jgi:hypothetical protein
MSQNLVSLIITDEQVAAVEAALAQIEAAFANLISLSADDRRSLTRMGQKSEAFCRQTVSVLEQNPNVVPPSIDLAATRQDMAALERLRPLLDRIERLAERGNDTEAALGSDIMVTALEGYALLKAIGGSQGLDSLRRELSLRFAKRRAKEEGAVPA